MKHYDGFTSETWFYQKINRVLFSSVCKASTPRTKAHFLQNSHTSIYVGFLTYIDVRFWNIRIAKHCKLILGQIYFSLVLSPFQIVFLWYYKEQGTQSINNKKYLLQTKGGIRNWSEEEDKGEASRLQSRFQEEENIQWMSRTIGWTMMDGEGPKEPEADATVFLPAAVGAELKIPLSLYMSSLHHVLLFPLSGSY